MQIPVDLGAFLAFLAGLAAVILFGLQAWYDRRDVLLSDHRRINSAFSCAASTASAATHSYAACTSSTVAPRRSSRRSLVRGRGELHWSSIRRRRG